MTKPLLIRQKPHSFANGNAASLFNRARDIPPPRSTLFHYFDLWNYDGTLGRIHYALYVKCREKAEREASPTACIIDSQSVRSAEKGGSALTRTGLMAASSSRARSGTF